MSAWPALRGRQQVGSARTTTREFQALCLVYGHDPHAIETFFDYRALTGFALLGVSFEFLDKGPEGGCAARKMPRHINQPLPIRERLLAVQPERNPGVRAHGLKQRGVCLGDLADDCAGR